MATYPAAIFEPRELENKSGVEFDEEKLNVLFAEDVNDPDAEIVAIETELGTAPKGSDADVKTRIARGEISDIAFIIDGGGEAIETGEKGHLEIPFKCQILQCTLLADVSGAIKIDIWKDTYAQFPPDNNDSICGGNEPEISASGVKDQDATLTDWTKTINAGDILAFNVDSCATITRVTISLKVQKIA